MMEFIYNIGQGIMENKDKIIMILTSSQFLGLVAALVGLWKTIKTTRANTESTNQLNAAVQATEESRADTKTASINTEKIKKLLEKFSEQVNEMEARIENRIADQTAKTNAIIDVQSIVYSTIKDERVRNTVNNLLLNAKYSETATRAELSKQIEELKNQVSEKTRQLTEFVNSTTNKVEAIVNGDEQVSLPESEEQEEVERY